MASKIPTKITVLRSIKNIPESEYQTFENQPIVGFGVFDFWTPLFVVGFKKIIESPPCLGNQAV